MKDKNFPILTPPRFIALLRLIDHSATTWGQIDTVLGWFTLTPEQWEQFYNKVSKSRFWEDYYRDWC